MSFRRNLAGAIALSLTAAAAAHAVPSTNPYTTRTWDGGAMSDSWSSPANWVGDEAPVPGDRLVFPAGAAQRSNTNDFPAGTQFQAIDLQDEGYLLAGQSIQLAEGVFAEAQDTGSSPPTIVFGLAFGGLQIIRNSGTAPLLVAGAVSVANVLTLDCSSGDVTLAGAVSGPGGLDKEGGATLHLSGISSFSGATQIGAGTVELLSGSGLGAAGGGTWIGLGSELRIGGSGLSIPEPLTVAGGTVHAVGNGANLTGPLAVSAITTIVVDAAKTLNVTGEISGGAPLYKLGAGTLFVWGASSPFSGATVVTAGELDVSGYQGGELPNSPIELQPSTQLGIGSGAVLGIVSSVGGRICPGCGGTSLGASGDLLLDADSTFRAVLSGISPGWSPRVGVTGVIDLGGAQLQVIVNYPAADGTSWTILDNDDTDAVFDEFADWPEGVTKAIGNGTMTITYQGGDGNDVVLTWHSDTLLVDGFDREGLLPWSQVVGGVADETPSAWPLVANAPSTGDR